MRKSSKNLFLHSQAKKSHNQSSTISFRDVTITLNIFILSSVFLKPIFLLLLSKSAQRQSQQQHMKSEEKAGREMYLPFLIAPGSICRKNPVIHQISKKFSRLLDCAVHKSCRMTYLCIFKGSEKNCLQFLFLSLYYPSCEFHSN